MLHAPNLRRIARGHCPRVKQRVNAWVELDCRTLSLRFGTKPPTPASVVEGHRFVCILLGAEAVRPMADPAMITDKELEG